MRGVWNLAFKSQLNQGGELERLAALPIISRVLLTIGGVG
jgi:hypothetical protein